MYMAIHKSKSFKILKCFDMLLVYSFASAKLKPSLSKIPDYATVIIGAAIIGMTNTIIIRIFPAFILHEVLTLVMSEY